MRVEIRPRGGGVGNPLLVEMGKVNVALAQATTAAWAYRGVRAYDQPATSLRALAGGLSSVWMTAIATEAFLERTGHQTLEAILLSGEPIRIIMKPRGSAVPVFADSVLAAYGLDRAAVERRGGKIIQVATGRIPSLLREGRADLYFESAIRGHPALTELTVSTSVRFLDLPQRVLEDVAGPGVALTDLPKWFPGQARPVAAADVGTNLITRRDLPDDTAYTVARVLCEHHGEIAKAHKAWANFDPAQAWRLDKTGVPLHRGAARYYREQGWM